MSDSSVDSSEQWDAGTDGSGFVSIPIQPRFFQASAFFPMPIVLLGTRAEDGAMNLAPYSLCFPRLDPGVHQLDLIARTTSKTAENLIRTGRVTINFIPDRPEYIEHCKALASPVSTEEKMARCPFAFVPAAQPPHASKAPPAVVAEAVQALECTLVSREPCSDGNDTRFTLEVETIRMQPYWARALELGRSGPRLPVDYGFRKKVSSWLSRPVIVSLGPRLRPVLIAEVGRTPAEVVSDFAAALAQPGVQVTGKIRRDVMQLGIPIAEQHTWSPSMDVSVEPTESGSIVRARIGPLPEVWLTFMFLHMLIALAGLAGLMWGVSQWMLDGPLWALWIPVGSLFLHAFVAGAALIGQGLSADQIYRLRTFVSDVLGP